MVVKQLLGFGIRHVESSHIGMYWLKKPAVIDGGDLGRHPRTVLLKLSG
jgi:hypothetical protein